MLDLGTGSFGPQAGLAALSLLGLQGQTILFAYTLCRVGGFVAFMPGFGEDTLPPRVKMVIALALTIVIMPFATNMVGHYPHFGFGLLVEVLVGVCLGLVVKMLYSAAHIAGSYIAMSIGIAGAIFFDPASGGETTAVSRIIVLSALMILVTFDLHHVFLVGLISSYDFQISEIFSEGSLELALMAMGKAMEIALRMAAPFIAYGFLFNLALGLLSRLTPQIQLFFILQPGNIVIGLALLMLVLGNIMIFFGEILISTFAELTA